MHTTITTIGLRLFGASALVLASGLSVAHAAQDQGQVTLEGQVDGFKSIRAREDQQERVLMRLRQEDGRSAIIDLGSPQNLQQVDLSHGDQVRITGTLDTIDGDRMVIRARRLQAEDERRDRHQPRHAERSRQDQAPGAGRPAEMETITGSVEHGRWIRSGEARGHVLELRREDGSRELVHMPANWDLDEQDLRAADQVTVRGPEEMILGRRMVCAREVQIDGRDVQPRDRTGQPIQYYSLSSGDPDRQQRQDSPEGRRPQDQPRYQEAEVPVDREDWWEARMDEEDPDARQQAGREGQQARSQRDGQDRTGRQDVHVDARRPGRGASLMLQGRVEDVEKVEVEGVDGEVDVARIRLQDGRSRILDLSAWMAENHLEIEPGDHIVVRGVETETRGGKSVVMVDGLVVIDQAATVSRR